ncbi:MAG: VWA domain-containing protein [Chthoniobacteraceae bacterium]|jgi:Ca-activated chloride channel family protein
MSDLMRMFTGLNWQFAHPWLLIGLLAVPVAAWLRGNRAGAPAVEFSSTEALRALGRIAESKAGNFLSGLQYLGLAALIVGLADPQKPGRTTTEAQASGIDIMILLDVSGSMLTEDYIMDGERTSRQDAVKSVTKRFIEGRPNDRIGMIAFASRPYLVSPLTLDHDWLLDNLQRVHIGQVEDGTAIGSAIASGLNRLRDPNAKSKVLILLTDGVNNCGKITPETAAEASKALGVRLYAIGAGTNGIAPVPIFEENTETPRLDENGKPMYIDVPVQFDETQLRRVAKIADGHFYRASDLKSMEDIFSEISKLETSTIHYKKYQEYIDLYPLFVEAGLVLIALEMIMSQTVARRLP